jgi:hypothetical protein
VESFDVIEYIGPGLVSGAVTAVVCSFTLEHPEESFTCRVVSTMADSAHGTDERVSLQEALIVAASKLTPAIGMQDH